MIQTLPNRTAASSTSAPALPGAGTIGRDFVIAPAQRTIRRFVRDDGICVLTFDRPGSSANIFDRRTLLELHEELEFVAAAPQLRGIILTSAKPSVFIAGVDLKMVAETASKDGVRELIELGQTVMNRLAALPIPTVAAIHGAALGGGYELCLACDFRVASTDRATKIGLPETQLGLIPAWGGSTRLPRLIGLTGALDIILAGKTLAAKPALKRGLVDELAPAEYLMDVAVRMINQAKSGRNAGPMGDLLSPPRDRFSVGKRSRRPRRWSRLLTDNSLAAALIGARLRSQLLKKTRGHYPAVLKALEVVTRAISSSISESLVREREGILELARTDACRNLIQVFFLQERAKKLTFGSAAVSAAAALTANTQRRTPDSTQPLRRGQPRFRIEPKPIARTAVIGCGVMGAGIAQWLSARQLPVILRDLNVEQVAKGMAAIARIYDEGARRHVFTPREVRQGLDRIYPAPAETPLWQADLVIEAAVEKLELKRKIFRRLDELTGDDAILATNTSALPISELAAGTRRPERVLGLHFFNPVHRMQLVEIVAARQTSPEVLQRALRFVQQIGKLPVIVKDSPGFLVNRILMPYLVEAGNLFEAGAGVTDLDAAMLDFGMPMGPMTLLDEVGIDVALHVAQTLAGSYRDRMSVPETLSRMVQAGLLGRKSGRGFYLHAKGRKPRPNPQITDIRATFSQYAARTGGNGSGTADSRSRVTRHDSPTALLQERMVLLMINEAARCLEEDVVRDPADVDFAMIMGTGFAPFRGGPLRYADTFGIGAVVGAMDRLANSGAPHAAPCALLRDMAAAGRRFYPNQ